MSTIAPPRQRSRREGCTQTPPRQPPLATYTAVCGGRRELVCLAGAGGTTLVVDRALDGAGERRLVAHLAADEPAANAGHVVAAYLGAPRICRSVEAADLQLAFGEGAASSNGAAGRSQLEDFSSLPEQLVDRRGALYRLRPFRTPPSIAQLRWSRQHDAGGPQAVSVRAVIGALEGYEPVLSVTRAALKRHEHVEQLSVAVLRAEYERAVSSPIVLNRGLREAVQRLTAGGELTMSEIAIRCGRVRRGERGVVSGETSWLARRIGLASEPGHTDPTPWVHSDVLALIARGLCLSPNEVEV
jgi:hypothetical protein